MSLGLQSSVLEPALHSKLPNCRLLNSLVDAMHLVLRQRPLRVPVNDTVAVADLLRPTKHKPKEDS